MNTLSSILKFIGDYIADAGVVEVTKYGVSSLPTTISDAKIKANHLVIESVLSNPNAQKDNWTVVTTDGTATISGTISGTTNITLLLAPKKIEEVS